MEKSAPCLVACCCYRSTYQTTSSRYFSGRCWSHLTRTTSPSCISIYILVACTSSPLSKSCQGDQTSFWLKRFLRFSVSCVSKCKRNVCERVDVTENSYLWTLSGLSFVKYDLYYQFIASRYLGFPLYPFLDFFPGALLTLLGVLPT